MPVQVFDPELIVARLEIAGTPFKTIEGAGEFDAVLEDARGVQKPAAYVVPVRDTAGDNDYTTEVAQWVYTRFAVMILLTSLKDARGRKANAALRDLRLWVAGQLLAWPPAATYKGCVYGGGQLFALGDGLMVWQEDYVTGLDTSSV